MRLVAIDVSGLPLLSGSQRCCLREALARAYLLQAGSSSGEPTFKIVDLRTPKLHLALKGLPGGEECVCVCGGGSGRGRR